MPQLIRGQGEILVFWFSDSPEKKTNVVGDIDILLPVMFRKILSSGWTEEVKIYQQTKAKVAIMIF